MGVLGVRKREEGGNEEDLGGCVVAGDERIRDFGGGWAGSVEFKGQEDEHDERDSDDGMAHIACHDP